MMGGICRKQTYKPAAAHLDLRVSGLLLSIAIGVVYVDWHPQDLKLAGLLLQKQALPMWIGAHRTYFMLMGLLVVDHNRRYR
jgi:hypothetical protein